MAIISAMPSADVVKGFAGVIDFYRWCNLTIARSWPKLSTTPQSDLSTATSARFTYITQQAAVVDVSVKPAYSVLASFSKWTWKDWQTSLWFKGRDKVALIPPD